MAGLLVAGLLLATPAAQAGARLSDLPALARARNERLRPKMVAALAPYMNDLAMDYGVPSNRVYLDRCVEEVAALGDSLVPLLLEKLRPDDPSPENLNTAANSARILARLGPAGFVPPLIDMMKSDNSIARGFAIPLLGKSGHVEAGRFLEGTLDTLPKSNLATAIHALRALGRHGASPKVADMLSSGELTLRHACLEFLTEFCGSDDRAKVLAALRAETQDSLLPTYVALLKRHAVGDGDAATTLLSLLDSGKLYMPKQCAVVHALAVVAPKGHEPTITRLRGIIQTGEIQQLGRACAQTMLALGDKSGRKELFEELDKEVRKNSKVPSVQATRGEANFAFEQWNDALRDFKEALRSARSLTMQREYNVWSARCYVRLQQYRRAAQILKESLVSKAELDQAAVEDSVFKQALTDQADLRALVRDLTR